MGLFYQDINLVGNQLLNSRLHNVTTSARIILGATLGLSDKGYQVFDTDTESAYYWNGTAWVTSISAWGSITGTLTAQTDLTTYLSSNYYPLASNPANYLTLATLPPVAITANITSDLQVGGIDAQELVPAGTTLQQFAELLLLTTFFPTLTAPSFSLSNNTGTVETGSIVSPLLTFTFNRGSINGALSAGVWNPALFQNFRAGASSSYTLNGTTQLGNTLSVTSYTVLNGSNTFAGTVSYLIGAQPLDSEGNNFSTPFPAGTSPSQSTSFTGIYPYYYYKSGSPITPADMQTAIGNGTATKVVGGSTGTLFIPYNVSGQYMSIAYPNTSTAKTKYFVTDLDKGDLGSLTSPFDLGTVLNCSSSLTYWSNIPYRIHVSPILTNSNPIIELRNP